MVGSAAAGQVTITCVLAGSDGNDYTVEFILASGPSQPTTAALVGNALVVTGGTDVAGENNSNGGAVVTAINGTYPEIFLAVMTGAGGMVPSAAGPIAFTGGGDAIEVLAGTYYEVRE